MERLERYILIWTFLHCQYLIYETTKCYLRFWKISSEIGPFFKDNLLPVNIRTRVPLWVSVSVCLSSCFTVPSLLPSAVVQELVFSRLMAFIKLLPLKFTAFEALRDSHYPNFGFFHLFSFFWQQLSIATMRSLVEGWKFHLIFFISIFRLLVTLGSPQWHI